MRPPELNLEGTRLKSGGQVVTEKLVALASGDGGGYTTGRKSPHASESSPRRGSRLGGFVSGVRARLPTQSRARPRRFIPRDFKFERTRRGGGARG